MKNKKAFLLAAIVMAAGCLLAGEESLPSNSIDWPEKLGMTPKMLFLVLQIGIIIFVAKLGGMVAGLLKLPSVLGELASGIIIGPWALGGIPISGFEGIFREGLFYGHALRAQAAAGGNPFAATPELYGICTIASVVLLFLSGIETNLKMFLRYAFAGSLVGIGGVVFSFAFGDLAAVYATTVFPDMLGGIKCLAHLGELVRNGEVVKAILDPAAMFMGIMSTATSVGITARILSEKKKMDSEEGVTIMAGAVIDDVLGIIVLAIGMGIIASQQGTGGGAVKWNSIGKTAANAFGVWLGGTLIGVLLARKISWLLKLFKTPVAIATLAFGLSLVIAGAFEALGLTLIIGAYVMGLALSRTDIRHLVQENLSSMYTFFVPIFFCVMGMMVDVSALCSKPVLIFGGIYTALAIGAKVIGCAIPSLFCGFNTLGALRVGAGMIPRGEVALIIAGIGLSNGYLTQEVFGIGIMMTLITTVVAPPMLVGLFKPTMKGVRHPRANQDGSRIVTFDLYSSEAASLMISQLIEEFQREGFFTSLLSQDDSIWEVTMDDMEISISRKQNQICFSCTPAEEAIAMTAWMEVTSKMSDLARHISRPLRREEVGKILKQTDADAPACGRSGIGRYLQGFVMLPKFRASSKHEAFEKMIEAIAESAANHVKDPKGALESVIKREESMPTGLDHGIAVPHGRSPDIVGIAGAVAIVDNEGTANGCIPDYETIDNSQISIIVLTLANSETKTPYLQLMSFISRALRGNDGYKKLLQCKTPEEMRKFFRSVR